MIYYELVYLLIIQLKLKLKIVSLLGVTVEQRPCDTSRAIMQSIY